MPEEEVYRVGEFWLTQRSDRPGIWQIAWYDKDAEQRRLRSTRTPDFQQAKLKIHEWALRHTVLKDEEPEEVPLARVFLDYWHEHAEKLASAEQQRIALNYWSDFYGGAMVSDLTPDQQSAFVEHLRKLGHSKGYISRTLSAGRSALRHALRKQRLKSVPFIADVETAADKRRKQPKGRPLTVEELGRFLDGIASRHLLILTVIAINTLSRPDALFDLCRRQCDFESGLIELNPPEREQTNKYRPIVPMTQTVRPWLLLPPEKPGKRRKVVIKTDHIVTYHGRPIESVKTAWRAARARAELDARVNPYSIRHTMARELRRRRVDPVEIDIMLGHAPPGNRTSEIYAPYEPDYCGQAVEAIDDFCQRLQQYTSQPITAPAQVGNASAILG